jgi:hypothetical protein
VDVVGEATGDDHALAVLLLAVPYLDGLVDGRGYDSLDVRHRRVHALHDAAFRATIDIPPYRVDGDPMGSTLSIEPLGADGEPMPPDIVTPELSAVIAGDARRRAMRSYPGTDPFWDLRRR